MNRFDVESIAKRIIKGESIRKIAKEYKVHKYYLFSYIMESNKYNDFPSVADISKFMFECCEVLGRFIGVNIRINTLKKKIYSEFNIGLYDLEEYYIEYKEIKSNNDSKLLDNYTIYEPYINEFEKIFEEVKNIYEECRIKFKIDCSVDKKDELDKIFESYREFKKVRNIYLQTISIMNLIEEGKTFKEACEIVNLEFKTYITYSNYTKNYNLMGYGMNEKTRKYYFKEDELMIEAIKEQECIELKREAENIEFKRGYKENDDLYKELEIIAAEKGLTKEEFIRVILLKHLDVNVTKVREFR